MICTNNGRRLGQRCILLCLFFQEVYKGMRRDIIEAILHTDITKHNEMVKDLSLFYQMNKDVLNIAELSLEVPGVFVGT